MLCDTAESHDGPEELIEPLKGTPNFEKFEYFLVHNGSIN